MSRSYGQLCGLALALDAIGDRWSLLIVRELLVRPEGARYTDLRDGLPGVATNLLAERLRALEQCGVIRRDPARPPVATAVFRLTERGAALRGAVEALALWGGESVPSTPGDAEFRTRWLTVPIEAVLRDGRPQEPAVRIEIRTGDEPLGIEIAAGRVRAARGPARDGTPDLVVSGPPKAVLGLVAGKLPVAAAPGMGVQLEGDRGVLGRVGLS
jgi:DNA-binding HxlR family transcriptional regulator